MYIYGCKRFQVVEEVQEVVREVGYVPSDAQELCSRLVCSLHLTRPSNAQDAEHLASELANEIGRFAFSSVYSSCWILNNIVSVFCDFPGLL